MHRVRFRLLLCCCLGGMFAHAADPDDFRGVWLGKIAAPNAQAELGLAFVSSQDGMLVSVNFPEMFLHRVNFGVADIRGDTFALAPLHLRVSRSGDVLSGTFGPARLPVELRRGGTFAPEPPVSDLPPGPAPVWTRSLGAAIWASPVAFEGVLYVGATDGKFHAVRASDGHPLWTWSGSHALYGEALATADRIYFVDERTQLICLDRSDGALVWRTPLHDEALAGGPPPANETFNHRTATPVADARGTLYVGSTDRGLYAIRAASGKILWRHDVKARVYAPVALRGDDVIVPCFDGSVVTINRRTRRELSRSQLGGALVSAPVVTPDRVVLGSRDYMLYALDRGGAVAWRNSFWFSWIESTPRFAGGTLYIGGSDFRRVSALDPKTGGRHWATDVRGLSWGTPLVTSDTVFAATAGQNLPGTVIKHVGGIVALDRTLGEWKWHYAAPAPDGADFTGFAGSLVLVSDLIVGAGVDGTLVALPAAAKP